MQRNRKTDAFERPFSLLNNLWGIVKGPQSLHVPSGSGGVYAGTDRPFDGRFPCAFCRPKARGAFGKKRLSRQNTSYLTAKTDAFERPFLVLESHIDSYASCSLQARLKRSP